MPIVTYPDEQGPTIRSSATGLKRLRERPTWSCPHPSISPAPPVSRAICTGCPGSGARKRRVAVHGLADLALTSLWAQPTAHFSQGSTREWSKRKPSGRLPAGGPRGPIVPPTPRGRSVRAERSERRTVGRLSPNRMKYHCRFLHMPLDLCPLPTHGLDTGSQPGRGGFCPQPYVRKLRVGNDLQESLTGGFAPDRVLRDGNYQTNNASSPRESKLGTRRPPVMSIRLTVKFPFRRFFCEKASVECPPPAVKSWQTRNRRTASVAPGSPVPP